MPYLTIVLHIDISLQFQPKTFNHQRGIKSTSTGRVKAKLVSRPKKWITHVCQVSPKQLSQLPELNMKRTGGGVPYITDLWRPFSLRNHIA